MAPQQRGGNFEEAFGGDVGVVDLAVGPDENHRKGQRIENGIGRAARRRAARRCGGEFEVVHAAALHASMSYASWSCRVTSLGRSAVSTRVRKPLSTSPETPALAAAASSAHPRCLRA